MMKEVGLTALGVAIVGLIFLLISWLNMLGGEAIIVMAIMVGVLIGIGIREVIKCLM